MNIPLEKLEAKFLSTALKNGLSYWKKDQFEVIEESNTSLKAKVYGTDEYLSELMFLGNTVIDVNCTCPNNRTLFCKHIAILYYEKLKDILDLKKAKPRKVSKRILKNKAEPSTFRLESAIENLSTTQLKDIIVQQVKINADFKLFLENKLNPKDQAKHELYSFYKAQIQHVLRKYKKQGYINYSASNTIGNMVVDYANIALEHYENNRLEASFEICKAIIDTMVKPLNYTDTSSGIFYMGLNDALNITLNIANTVDLNSSLKKNMYAFFLKTFKDKNTHDWGYETNFLDILIGLAENENQKEALLTIIYNLGVDNYTMQLYHIIKKFDGNKVAKNFIIEHKALPEFRTILFDEFMKNKNYEAAKECMYEGITVNEEFHGTVISWIKNLLKIAEITHDKALIIKSTKALFLNLRFSIYPEDVDYYQTLKSQFTTEEWESEWHLLTEKIKEKTTLEEIYYREGHLDLLLKSMSENKDLYFSSNHLNFNEKHIACLLPKYNESFKRLLLKRITEYIDVYKGKSYYKDVCITLITFKKQGLDISGIINYLKENYQKRPSLMARLNEYFE